MHIYINIYIRIYIWMYIQRGREREREWQKKYACILLNYIYDMYVCFIYQTFASFATDVAACRIHVFDRLAKWHMGCKDASSDRSRSELSRMKVPICICVETATSSLDRSWYSYSNPSNPQIDGKVNHHQISRDSIFSYLFHLFGDDYNHLWTDGNWRTSSR